MAARSRTGQIQCHVTEQRRPITCQSRVRDSPDTPGTCLEPARQIPDINRGYTNKSVLLARHEKTGCTGDGFIIYRWTTAFLRLAPDLSPTKVGAGLPESNGRRHWPPLPLAASSSPHLGRELDYIMSSPRISLSPTKLGQTFVSIVTDRWFSRGLLGKPRAAKSDDDLRQMM
ncbi:hypothetical protein Bbelb_368130 [Branchiostoma belcheri]|nr:hypothetical protein Bbelb_368130 [Branchiostoma belcheri]